MKTVNERVEDNLFSDFMAGMCDCERVRNFTHKHCQKLQVEYGGVIENAEDYMFSDDLSYYTVGDSGELILDYLNRVYG